MVIRVSIVGYYLVGTFNKEKSLVGAFSRHCESTDDSSSISRPGVEEDESAGEPGVAGGGQRAVKQPADAAGAAQAGTEAAPAGTYRTAPPPPAAQAHPPTAGGGRGTMISH